MDSEIDVLGQAWDLGKTVVLVICFTMMFVLIWNGIKTINKANIDHIVLQNDSIQNVE